MGAFDEALRALLLDEQMCPRCKACNIPHAKPTIEHEQDGSLTCASCGHNWVVKA